MLARSESGRARAQSIKVRHEFYRRGSDIFGCRDHRGDPVQQARLGLRAGLFGRGRSDRPVGARDHLRRRGYPALRRTGCGVAAVPHRPRIAAVAAVGVATLDLRHGTHAGAGDRTGARGRGVVAFVILITGGRYLLRPLFRVIASSGSHKIFTAASLMLVIVSTFLMEAAGLSMALGAFVAGMLLADSEYRHEIEASIEPFKGLLLGLFFMAVGMSIHFGLLAAHPLQVLGLMIGLLVIKSAVLYVLSRVFRLPADGARKLAVVLPQGGEFAFVLFSAAITYQVLDRHTADMLILVVSLSMAATPLLLLANERLLTPWLGRQGPAEFDRIDEPGNPVIIAGFGRVGQIVGRLLRVKQIPFTALEISQTQGDFVRTFGGKLYYGDASRRDLLRAAHIEQARVFVLAVDDVEASLKIAETVKRNFPHLQIYARARNRHHAHLLMDLGIKHFVRETYYSSLRLAEQVLCGLGLPRADVAESIEKFRTHDEAALIKQHAIHHDEKQFIQSVKDAAEELQSLFEADAASQQKTAQRKVERSGQ